MSDLEVVDAYEMMCIIHCLSKCPFCGYENTHEFFEGQTSCVDICHQCSKKYEIDMRGF